MKAKTDLFQQKPPYRAVSTPAASIAGDLRRNIATVLPERCGRAIELTFARIAPDRPVDYGLVKELATEALAVLRQLLSEADVQPAVQATYHGFWVELLRQCRTQIAAHCRELPLSARVEAVLPLLAHVMEDPGETLAHIEEAAAWHRTLERLAGRAKTTAEQVEMILQLPGLLTQPQSTASVDPGILRLESTFEGAALENSFGLLLTSLRGPLTQTEFAAIFATQGLGQVELSTWERGDYVPPRRKEPVVRAIAEHFHAPQLYREWQRHRERIEQKNPIARRRDVDFHAFLRQFGPEFKDFVRYSAKRLGVMRAGKRFSRGELAKNSVKSYVREVSHGLAAISLPVDSPNPRTRGLGWTEDIGLVSLILPEAIDADLTISAIRRGSASGQIAAADKVGLALRRSWVSQPDGWLWKHAEKIAALNPFAVNRLATHWPQDALINAGKRCESPADRIRAQCLIAAPVLERLHDAANRGASRPQHHAALGAATMKFSLPLAGIFATLDRLKLEGELRSEQKWNEALVASYLARSAYRPPRISDGLALELHALQERDGEFILYVSRPQKNREAKNACNEYLGEVPRELQVYLRPYHRARMARGGSPTDPYFTSYDGTPVTPEKLRYLLGQVVRGYGGDIFPLGLGSHDMRYLVTTSMVVFAGKEIGLSTACIALRDDNMTITQNYILVRLDDSYRSPFPARHFTLAEMIRFARRQAREYVSDFAPNVPKPKRRSAFEIAKAKARFRQAGRSDAT